jgi:hypothetical protein
MPVYGALLLISLATAAFNTTVPVSEESASSIAVSLFPVAVKLAQTNLFLTNPRVVFMDSERIGIRASLQAYDHRPAEGIAISETGEAMLSGRVSYDRATRQVLLHDARVESLAFDRTNAATRRFSRELQAAWSTQVTNPIRTELPPHPYLAPFRNNIDQIVYDGDHLSLVLVYQ